MPRSLSTSVRRPPRASHAIQTRSRRLRRPTICRRIRSSATSTTQRIRTSGRTRTTGRFRLRTAAMTAATHARTTTTGPLHGPRSRVDQRVMEAAGLSAEPPKRSVSRRLADLFHGRPRLQVGALLAGPIGWLVLGYLGSLVVLLIAAFWSVDALSGELIKGFTFDNYKELWDTDVYRSVAFRTIGIASAVTLTDALLAFPIAFYMAKLASRRAKGILVVAVLMPLWSFYLVKVYAWQTMLSAHGIINWALDPIGLNGPGFGATAVWIVESYLWLPYMILPIYAGLERIPNSLLSASEDLGAKPFETFRRVILPMAFPAVVAGSIFTFSLTLGDYITPSLVSPDTQFIGNVVFSSHTNNLPLASAFATVPIVVMVVYLLIARRLGAFEHL